MILFSPLQSSNTVTSRGSQSPVPPGLGGSFSHYFFSLDFPLLNKLQTFKKFSHKAKKKKKILIFWGKSKARGPDQRSLCVVAALSQCAGPRPVIVTLPPNHSLNPIAFGMLFKISWLTQIIFQFSVTHTMASFSLVLRKVSTCSPVFRGREPMSYESVREPTSQVTNCIGTQSDKPGCWLLRNLPELENLMN